MEKDKYDDGIEYFVYSTNVASLDALVGYYFVEDKLYSAKYLFQEKHSNRNDFISDFNKIIFNKPSIRLSINFNTFFGG